MGQCNMRQGLLASAHVPSHFLASLEHVFNYLLLSSTQQPLRLFTTPPPIEGVWIGDREG